MVEYSSRTVCSDCSGRGRVTILKAPDPKQKNILRLKEKKCKLCKGLGVIFVYEQALQSKGKS